MGCRPRAPCAGRVTWWGFPLSGRMRPGDNFGSTTPGDSAARSRTRTMSPLPRPRVAFGLTLLAAVVAVPLTADAQPRVAGTVAVPVGPGGKKKDGKEKDDRDWNEAIFLPVEREAKNKIDAVNKYLQGKEGTITPKLWEDIISVLQ